MLYFIMGVLVWQIISTIIAIVCDRRNIDIMGGIASIFVLGFPSLFIILFVRLLELITTTNYKKNWNVYDLLIKSDEKTTNLEPIWIKKKDVKKFYKDGENKYSIHLRKLGSEFRNPRPSKKEIYKGQTIYNDFLKEEFK